MDFETVVVTTILSLVAAIIIIYVRDVRFKLRLEARSRYLTYLEKQLAELYLPLYEKFFGLFKHTDEFVFDAPADFSRDKKIVWYFEQKKEDALWEDLFRDEDEAAKDPMTTYNDFSTNQAPVSNEGTIQFGFPSIPALFSELERIVTDKVYLLSPDLQKEFVLLMSVYRMIEDARSTSEKFTRTMQARVLSLNGMKAKVQEMLESAEKRQIEINDEELSKLVERKNEVFEKLKDAEKRQEEHTEGWRTLAETLKKTEKKNLRLFSLFIDQVFLQYEQITQEHEKEIQEYRRSIDSKCWFR